ncbi:hypothetical protein DSECCO2_492790 [anaerobic digester metagenome]
MERQFAGFEKAQQARADAEEQGVAVGQDADVARLFRGMAAQIGRETRHGGQGQPALLLDAYAVEDLAAASHEGGGTHEPQQFRGAVFGAQAEADDVDHAASEVSCRTRPSKSKSR